MSLTLYSSNGDRRTISFKLGALNVITGQSKTGKTVLVKLIDYCLGRRDIPTSAGGVESALSWVGALWQFDDGGRAFVGRPLPGNNAQENTEALLIIGDNDLHPLPFEAMVAGTNTRSMRIDLGTRIGITESQIDQPSTSNRAPLRTHLGHAALLCLQNQDEVSSSTRIFHRSGERGIDETLRDTIPYFLGAVPADQALLKSLLRSELRRLQRTERDLLDAENTSKNIDDDLRSLLTEAVDAGLVVAPQAPSVLTRGELLGLLHGASRDRPAPSVDPSPTVDQDTRRRVRADVAVADDELDQLMQQRALLLDESQGGSAYADAIDVQVGRLTSINLLPTPAIAVDGTSYVPKNTIAEGADTSLEADLGPGSEDAEADTAAVGPAEEAGADPDDRDGGESCPVCGQTSPVPDPTAAQMHAALVRLRGQLVSIRSANPAKSAALDDLNGRITDAQARVQQARNVLEATFAADSNVGRNPTRRRDFTRGRIDAILARAPEADESNIGRLRERVALAQQAVDQLRVQLSDESEQERLNSRMLAVGANLTAYARELHLEHSERDVRIDLARLTVIADVDDNPVPLHRIGSAENWIGYHIASHLALHQTFIRHERPVPRLLVIDQPSQGHYPSEMAKRTGRADTDEDELAVRRLYELMEAFTRQSDGKFQVIAVDHADIDRDWFQDAVVENWRGVGNALIPLHWLPGAVAIEGETSNEAKVDAAEQNDDLQGDADDWPTPASVTADELVSGELSALLESILNARLDDLNLGLPPGAPDIEEAYLDEVAVQVASLQFDLVEEYEPEQLVSATMRASVTLTGEMTADQAEVAEQAGKVVLIGDEHNGQIAVRGTATFEIEVEAGVRLEPVAETSDVQDNPTYRWSDT